MPLAPTFVDWPESGARAYGAPRADHTHNGIDLGAAEGQPVYAAAPGIVELATSGPTPGFAGYGRVVVLRADDGTWQLYAHLQRAIVAPGQRIKAGEQIGTVGRTAYREGDPSSMTAGPHLHFEVSATPYPQSSSAPRLHPLRYLELGRTHPTARAPIALVRLPPVPPVPPVLPAPTLPTPAPAPAPAPKRLTGWAWFVLVVPLLAAALKAKG